ncbi:hypothetical protein CLV74_12521 [Donghicola tyrosinivorans]|uniref:Uncharacterized protein n=1 Tax=Donghicola tyrosinivorans TaxID=1652492 RepID=A0A2T0WCD3_9RHOB|nr:hypothetical protein CLV74_12521 [Donghicola tyrosinivorans]
MVDKIRFYFQKALFLLQKQMLYSLQLHIKFGRR